jgi:ABC-type dipeptide/oligopeptide/nickel transport system ATPase component
MPLLSIKQFPHPFSGGMCQGRISETADSDSFFENRQNVYSIELLSLMPRFDCIFINRGCYTGVIL